MIRVVARHVRGAAKVVERAKIDAACNDVAEKAIDEVPRRVAPR